MRFRNPFKRKERTYTLNEMENYATLSLLENFDEFQHDLQEAHSSGFPNLFGDEDFNFIRLGDDSRTDNFIPEHFRWRIVRESRVLSITDSITKQSIGLYTDFGVGTGMAVTIKGENKEKAQEIINGFIENPENNVMLNSKGQRELSDSLLINGEIFFIFFIGANKEVIFRILNSLEIKDIATDLEDEKRQRFFKRIKRSSRNNTVAEKEFIYKAWDNIENRPGELQDGQIINKATSKGEIYHITLGGTTLRGFPLVTSQIKWTRAHRSFMTARIAIQQGLARIIKNIKVKGGSRAIDKVKSVIQSSKVGVSGPETNPAPAFGATQIDNAAVETSTNKQETGANSAKIDGSMLVSMAGAAVGIFPHYFGFGESFRLATATAMEVPMLKRFEAYRVLWTDTYKRIFIFVLKQHSIDTSKLSFDINYPEIFPRSMEVKIEAQTTVADTIPALKFSEEYVAFMLDELGLSDPNTIVSKLDLKNQDLSNSEERQINRKVQEEVFKLIKEASKNKVNVN